MANMQSRALVTFIAHFAKNMFGLFKKRALRKFRLVWYGRLKINTSKYTILVVCWSRKNDTTTRAHMLARVDQHFPFTQRCTVYYMINNGFPLLRGRSLLKNTFHYHLASTTMYTRCTGFRQQRMCMDAAPTHLRFPPLFRDFS